MDRFAGPGVGPRTEHLVASQLEAAGWTVLGRNVRFGRRELDIVAIDPGPPPSLVAVEVRWRGSRRFGLVEDSFDHAKQARVREGIGRLVEAGAIPGGPRLPGLPVRADLVVVEPGLGGRGVRLRHHRHALGR